MTRGSSAPRLAGGVECSHGHGMQDMSQPESHATEPPAAGDSVASFDELAMRLRPTAAVPAAPASPPARPAVGTLPYRPTLRRPMALLHVVDDGRDQGEVFRIRTDRVEIGRTEGEIVIPHDITMSPKHAAIERLPEGGWSLLDLGSASGSFVRVTSARLVTGSVVQIGRSRLRFEELSPTSAWLIETRVGEDSRRLECRGPLTTIGRTGAECDITLPDPFVSPLHASLRRTPQGWRIANSGWNGLWVRIDRPVRMPAASQFLCGEQRFVFEPLP